MAQLLLRPLQRCPYSVPIRATTTTSRAITTLGLTSIAKSHVAPLSTFKAISSVSSPGHQSTRSLHLNQSLLKGLSPESEDPPEPTVAAAPKTPIVQVELSADEFQHVSEEFFELLHRRLDELAEKEAEIDVEYSNGVLNAQFPRAGTYVLNKQPPNKQIWLSSPLSGPKRYDFVTSGDGMGDKEGTGSGEWVYLRDGTKLIDLLKEEVGVDMTADTTVAI